VHAGDDQIEGLKYVFGKIQRAIGKNVGFDAFKDVKLVAVAPVEPVDLLLLASTSSGFRPPA
jgi:hypothetical protein